MSHDIYAKQLGSVAYTCCKVNVVLFLRCFLLRNPSSKSPAAWLPKEPLFTEEHGQ